MIDYTKAILFINPNAKFMMWENDPTRIVWNDAQHTGVKPTKEECDLVVLPEVDKEVVCNGLCPAHCGAKI